MTESKILIDAPPGVDVDVEFLESLGHPVMHCSGPEGVECPIVETGSCPIAEEAHGIVFILDLDNEQHRKVLDAYRTRLRDDLPIGVVVKDGEQATKYAAELSGYRIWDHVPAAGDLDALAAQVESEEA
jgi:hypothetical protein